LNLLTAYPLTGVGFGQFPATNGGMTAHNSFVLCFAELGLPGFFCWMGCVYYGFKAMKRPADSKERDDEGAPRPDDCPAGETALPVLDDLAGSRLALASYLVACFWISRTYALPTYVLFCLPIVGRLLVLKDRSPQERTEDRLSKDWGKIGLLCAVMIFFISLMVRFLY
jgi:O-antigen ligase